MLTKGIEVMKYVRASAGRAGIEIVFEEINQPRHDGKTIYLPRIVATTTDDELKQLMCSVDHEVAHDRFSSFEVLKEKGLDANGILMFVWNLLEDSRVNIIEAKEYKGFKENWDKCSCPLVDKIMSKAAKEASTITNVVSAMLYWDSKVCAPFFPSIEAITSKFSPDPKVLDVLNNFSDRLVDCHSILDKRLGTEATYQLAYDILTKFGKECKKEIIGEKKPTASDKDGGKKTAGTVKGKKEEMGSSKPSDKEEKEGASDKDGGEDDEDEYKVIEVKLTAKDLEELSLSMPEDGKEMGKVGINFKPVSTSGTWDLTDYERFSVVNYPKDTGRKVMLEYGHYPENFIRRYKTEVGSKLISQENFAQQVRRLIQIKARVQTQYGVKKGKLDQSRLSRICFDAPGFNERVFKNRIENKTLDAAITVLVDMSGSMGGHKAFYALASTLLMNEVCSTLNIPVEIIGFTDAFSESASVGNVVPVMFVYKNFSDLRISNDDITRYFAISASFMAGNPDGENILWAHDRLIKRKERKKILVVMSDGSPAASKGSKGLGEFTLKVIREIEASKKVDIYGLGLCADDVSYYYKANSVVTSPEQIPGTLLSLIEKKILC